MDDIKKWAELQEFFLKSQLKAIRQFLRESEETYPKTEKER